MAGDDRRHASTLFISRVVPLVCEMQEKSEINVVGMAAGAKMPDEIPRVGVLFITIKLRI